MKRNMGAFLWQPPREEEKVKLTSRDAPSDMARPNPRRLTDVDLRFQSETVRLVGYAGFWLIVLIGVSITNATKGWYPGGAPADLSTCAFGYNICAYVDYPYPPATCARVRARSRDRLGRQSRLRSRRPS